MKKLFTVLLAMLMVLTLAACSSNNETVVENTSKKVVIATSPDYPPFEDVDTNGNPIGFDIDLANAVFALAGYEVEWTKMDFDAIVSAVQLGTVDFGVSGFSYDPEKQVCFSDAYYNAGQVIITTVDSNLNSLDAFAGKLVCAQTGTTCADAATEALGDSADVTLVQDSKASVEGLKAGQYDGVALDAVVANNYVNNDSSLVIACDLVDDSYAMITASDNSAMMDEVNAALATFMASADYNELIEKWGM